MGDLDPELLSLTTRRRMADIQDFLAGLSSEDLAIKKPQETPKQETPSLLPAVGYALMRGTYGLGAEIGGVLGTVGTTLGSETITQWGETAASYWQKAAESLPRRDPRKLMEDPSVLISPGWWAENVAEALPGFAAFLVPSMTAPRMAMVAGRYLSLTPKMVGKLAWIGQKTAGPAMFSAQEMGSVYNEVRARGGSESDAARVATEAAFVAAGLGAINLHYLLGEGGSFLRNAGRGAVSNTIISFLADTSRGQMLGDDVLETLKQSVNAMPVQAALGAAAGGAFGKRPEKPGGKPEGQEAAKAPEVPRSAALEAIRAEWQTELSKPKPEAEVKADEAFAAELTAKTKVAPAETERLKEGFAQGVKDLDLLKKPEYEFAVKWLTDALRKRPTIAESKQIRQQALDVVRANPDADILQIMQVLAKPEAERLSAVRPPTEEGRTRPQADTVVWGHDTLSKGGKLILGPIDAENLDRIAQMVEAAQETGKTARIVAKDTGEVEGYRPNQSMMPDFLWKTETEAYSRKNVQAVIEMIKRGERPQNRATEQLEIFDRIFQQLKKEKPPAEVTETAPVVEPTLEERGTQLMAEIEKAAAEEQAPKPTETAPESTIATEQAPKAVPPELTDWQRKYVEMAETGNLPAEPKVEVGDFWPGEKPMQIDESARPILEGLKADAEVEAARVRQKRGIMEDEQVAAEAKRLITSGEFTLATLLEAPPGTVWRAEQLKAGLSIVQAIANRVAKLADLVAQGEGSGVGPEQFRKALNLFETAFQAYSAAYSEAGRALRSGRMDQPIEPAPWETLYAPEFQTGGGVPPGHPAYGKIGGTSEAPSVDIQAAMNRATALGRGADPRFLAQQIASLKTKQGKQQVLGLWASTGRAGMELFYGSILTPLSVARNAIAIPATLAYHVGTVATAEAGRRFSKMIAPERVDEARGIVEGSTAAAWKGLQQGLHDAWQLLHASWDTYREVARKDGSIRGLRAGEERLRIEAQNLGPLSFERMRTMPDIASENFGPLQGMLGSLVDVIGLAARLPGMTGLTAGDIVSKVVSDRMGIAMKAHEMAIAQGYRAGSPEYINETARLIRERPPAIDTAGVDSANKNSFTGNEGWIGKATQFGSHPLMRLFVSPFWRTPLRIMEYTLEGTPILQNLTKGWWQDVRSGDPARRDVAFAKMAVGWSMFAVVGALAANGVVTGTGPRDPREKEAKRATGWQPLSVNIPGVGAISFSGMEPLSSWIGMAADFTERAAQLPDANIGTLLYTLAIAAGDNLMVKRYMEGFSEWLTVLRSPSPEEQMNALRDRLALPFPFQGTLGLIRRGYVDPQVKDARTLLDRYLSYVPGGSELVPAKRNIITGEPQYYEGAWGPDFLSPFFSSSPKNDPVLDEIARLRGAGLRRVPEALGGHDEGPIVTREPLQPFGVPLTPRQQEEWTVNMTQTGKIGGRTLHQRLSDLIVSPFYKSRSELAKTNAIRDVYDDYRTLGKRMLLQAHPELAAQLTALEQQRMLLRYQGALR